MASVDMLESKIEEQGASLEKAREAFRLIRSNIQLLFKAIGAEFGTCEGCGKPIWWVMTKNRKRAPMTEDALNHFADCPNADKFRKSLTRRNT